MGAGRRNHPNGSSTRAQQAGPTTGKGELGAEAPRRWRELPPGSGKGGDGCKTAAAARRSGPKTAKRKVETGHGKGQRQGWPALTGIEEGEGPRCVDGGTSKRKTSGLPMTVGMGGIGHRPLDRSPPMGRASDPNPDSGRGPGVRTPASPPRTTRGGRSWTYH